MLGIIHAADFTAVALAAALTSREPTQETMITFLGSLPVDGQTR